MPSGARSGMGSEASVIRGRRPSVPGKDWGFVNRHGEPEDAARPAPLLRLAARLPLCRAVSRGGLLPALSAGLASLAKPRCGRDRGASRRSALHPHPVHAGHQLCRRPGGGPADHPDRTRLGLLALVCAALGGERVLADAAGERRARRQLDHDHAADRDRGGDRHPRPRAGLWPGQAVGLSQLHRGQSRFRPHHRQDRAGGGAPAPGCGHGADGRWRPSSAARVRGTQAFGSGRAAWPQARRRLQPRARAAVPVVSPRREPDPGEPRPLLQLRHAQLAGARHP